VRAGDSRVPGVMNNNAVVYTTYIAQGVGFSDELCASIVREPRSKVTFDIEPLGEKVKLTVVHDGFELGSAVLERIGGGWPAVLSNLKTLLEMGEPLEPEAMRVR
jgi:hypothetical protein